MLVAVLAVTLGAHKPKVAVLDVQDVSGDQARHAKLLTQILVGEVARTGSIEVISSAQIAQMLGYERQRQLLGCTDSSCLAELGGALGVDYLLSSQLGRIGSRYRLDLSLIDQKKSRLTAANGDFLPAQEDALADAAVRMVNELLRKAGLVDAATAALSAHVSSEPPSHTAAYVSFGSAVALLAGAGVMTAVTRSSWSSAVADYERNPNVPSPNGARLAWMSPLTDALWVAGVGTAALGTYLYFSGAPSGSGGEVAAGGRF